MVDGTALDHGENPVAVLAGGVQRLEQQRRDAFARHETIGSAAEGMATAARREHVLLAQLHVLGRVTVEVDPADQRGAALAFAQAFEGHVQGGQRRRAGGVDSQARATQVQRPGHPVGHRPGQAAGDRGLPGLPQRRAEQRPGVAGDADEHADIQRAVGVAQQLTAFAEVAAVFQGVPGALQEQPLLRIEAGRFARRNSEKLCIEVVDVVEKAAPFGVAQATVAGIGSGLEKALQRPALARDLADRIQPLQQVLPELVEVVGIGKTPVQADDSDIHGVTVRPPKGKWSEVRPGCLDRCRCRWRFLQHAVLRVCVEPGGAGLGVFAQQVFDHIVQGAAVEQQGLVQAGEHRLDQFVEVEDRQGRQADLVERGSVVQQRRSEAGGLLEQVADQCLEAVARRVLPGLHHLRSLKRHGRTVRRAQARRRRGARHCGYRVG